VFTCTFYSYKGGVGRTLALANSAYELAKRGQRVLLVDFDLEAPGIDTFELFAPSAPCRGVVEFVGEYRNSLSSPDVRNFVYRVPEEKIDSDEAGEPGEIWVMPAGFRDATYSLRLGDIDWMDLYENQDGYLLFEDLKAQWAESLQLDYVLVDSRTGHTDIGGICTRQLPDLVVVLFFPNDQNLLGLEGVVSEIRAEAEKPRERRIDLLFVMSNIPDLDDEARILANTIRGFRERLGFDRLDLRIHRYDSLRLLNQGVFTKDRPHSRLAKEYRRLTSLISQRNPASQDGAEDPAEEDRPRGA